MSVSYHNVRDEELAQRQQDLEDRVKVLIKLDAEEVACYPAGFKVRTSHAYLMGLIIPRIEVIRQQRMELADEISVDEDDDEHLALEVISTPKPLTSSSNDIITPKPLSPAPNILVQQPRPYLHPYSPSQPQPPDNVITTLPLDNIIPIPFPPSPNTFQLTLLPQTCFHLHPPPQLHLPNIVAPPPLPLKPNIPHTCSFQMFEDEHHLEGGRCVLRPRPCLLLSPISLSFSPFSLAFSFICSSPLSSLSRRYLPSPLHGLIVLTLFHLLYTTL